LVMGELVKNGEGTFDLPLATLHADRQIVNRWVPQLVMMRTKGRFVKNGEGKFGLPRFMQATKLSTVGISVGYDENQREVCETVK